MAVAPAGDAACLGSFAAELKEAFAPPFPGKARKESGPARAGSRGAAFGG
jgi:hypothetical protein